MKSISKIWLAITLLLSAANTYAQSENLKMETVKINGACDMCKSTIENAGNISNVAKVEWNTDTKQAVLKYDTVKTSRGEILKRIASVGYDNQDFLAPEDIYNQLPECCQYTREPTLDTNISDNNLDSNKQVHKHVVKTDAAQIKTQLQTVINGYFAIKDALVKTDGKSAAVRATELMAVIKAIDMDKLATNEHSTWMKVRQNLTESVESISKTKSISRQRDSFLDLSKYTYELTMVADLSSPVFYQHCPMYNSGKGGHWLSKELNIKNPYFGSSMLTCGETIETLD